MSETSLVISVFILDQCLVVSNHLKNKKYSKTYSWPSLGSFDF